MAAMDERLKSLGIVLPDVMPPVVDGYVPAFAPFARSGDQIHLSGRLGKEGGKPLCSAATSDVRGLLGRSRLPPIRGHTPSAPLYELRCVGSLKQLPKRVCQKFDGLPQGAELPNPDYRDGSVQVKRWGTQYFHGIDRMIPGNKASG